MACHILWQWLSPPTGLILFEKRSLFHLSLEIHYQRESATGKWQVIAFQSQHHSSSNILEQAGEMWGIEKKAGERSETETEWEEWEGRANFHNEKVIICGVRASFWLVSVACQLLARGHCEVPAMHTNSLTKPRPHCLSRLKNVSFTFPLPSHLSSPINPPSSRPTLHTQLPLLLFFSHISLSFPCSFQGTIW